MWVGRDMGQARRTRTNTAIPPTNRTRCCSVRGGGVGVQLFMPFGSLDGVFFVADGGRERPVGGRRAGDMQPGDMQAGNVEASDISRRLAY